MYPYSEDPQELLRTDMFRFSGSRGQRTFVVDLMWVRPLGNYKKGLSSKDYVGDSVMGQGLIV